jgi:hypothetical protein
MRFPIRSFATLAMMVGVATFSDTPIAAVKTGTSPTTRFGVGRIALAPVFSKAAEYAAAHLADFPSVRYDSVRVVIRGTPNTAQVVKDTTVFFNANSSDLTLELNVPVQNDGQRFQAGMDYRGPDGVVFSGTVLVQSHRPDQPAPAQQPIIINYVGAGSKVKSIAVTPRTLNLVGSQTSALTVAAVDSNDSPIAVPLAFSSSNTSIATVSNSGVVQAQNRRGTATLTVRTPSGVTDNATVSVSLPPSAIGVVSGNAQSGRVGSTLADAGVVQVSGSDGIGVPGVSVIFAAPAGGSVSPATATTDATGRASTTMKLGTVAGPQGFTATAAGISTAITATAVPGDPSTLTIVSGNNQSDSVRALLAPVSVRLSDSFNNPIAGATVSWAKSGGGTLSASTTTTDSDGIATNRYTLGTVPGRETVTASAGGATAAFTFTTHGGRPASIVAISGGGQSARVSQTLANPLVVKVADAAGNPVRDAAITWTAQNATITSTTPSDANGQASAIVTLGTTAGPATVTAAIAAAQGASFTATAQAGPPTNAFFSTQPMNGLATQTLAPVRVALRDAANNAADGMVTIALGNNPNGAVLGGTLSQPAINGIATFGNLTLDRSGTGYTLRASSGAVGATSTAFDVGAGTASQLLLLPSSPTAFRITAGSVVGGAPFLVARDAGGNAVAGVPIHLALMRGSTIVGAKDTTTGLDGTLALPPAFLAPTAAGTYSVVATSSAVPNASPTITVQVDPGAAAKLAFTPAPTTATANSPLPVVVEVQDAFGNAVASSGVSVTISATPSNPSGNVATTNASGTASFSLTFVTAGTYALSASAAALSPATATVVVASNSSLTVDGLQLDVPTSVANNATFTPTVQLRGAGTNVSRSGVTVTATIAAPANATSPQLPDLRLGTSTTVTATTDANGVATFSGIRVIGAASERFALRFATTDLGTNVSATSADIMITPGAAQNLIGLSGSGQIGLIGAPLPTGVRVQLVDTTGNATSYPATTVTFTASGNGAAPASVGTDNAGQATGTWTLATTEGTNTLTATATLAGTTRTATFTATGSDVHAMVFSQTPSASATIERPLVNQPWIQLTDGKGNPLRKSGVAITATI